MLLDHLTDPYHNAAMSSNSFFASAPTVVLPPSQDQYFVGSHYANQSGQAPAINGISPNGLSNSKPFTPSASTPPAVTPGSLAGRKRSRGDIFSEVEEEGDRLDDGSVPVPTIEELNKLRGKPIHGPGMTLIYPDDPAYAMAAESQSGTWVEDQSTRKPFQLAHAKRPSVTSRKSQRMDSSAAGPDDLAQLVLPPQMREVTTEPLIDEATRSLGISWTRMDSTEALQINQKAYAKWIQNHYPGLKEVAIWFENSAIPGYLVAALNAYSERREFYIFSNDLTEARLVTSDPSQLVPRLKMLPALHLAAPGGCIRAESEPVTASQNELNNIQAATAATAVQDVVQPSGGCAAHAMELD